MIGAYQQEQIEALEQIRAYLGGPGSQNRKVILQLISEYLSFRDETSLFLKENFNDICNQKCYRQRLSACCSREGIITFYADVAINAVVSSDRRLDHLGQVLRRPNTGFKCIYLGPGGCLWKIKPIVCELFVCDAARAKVFSISLCTASEWKRLETRAKDFKWPDRPVLFDLLEQRFMAAGFRSSLMYFHNSPGLLRVKMRAGLLPSPRSGPRGEV